MYDFAKSTGEPPSLRSSCNQHSDQKQNTSWPSNKYAKLMKFPCIPTGLNVREDNQLQKSMPLTLVWLRKGIDEIITTSLLF